MVLNSSDDANGLPAPALVVGGDKSALAQAAVATAQGWPLVVASGSHGAIVASGAGALVAALGAETWVALTAAVSAAPLAYIAHLQVDSTIVADNPSAARLEGVVRRWHARPPEARTPRAFGELVAETEAVMTAERRGWVEQMTEALRDLQTRQQKQQDPAP